MHTYGVLELTATSPAQTFTEPVTVDEMIAHLHLPDYSPPNTDQTTVLEQLITAARIVAEAYQRKSLVGQQWDLTLDAFLTREIQLQRPLASVDLFTATEYDGTVTTLTENVDFRVDLTRGLVMPIYGDQWPALTLQETGGILIRHSTSAPDLPHVKIGIIKAVAKWFEDASSLDSTGDLAVPREAEILMSLGRDWSFF